MKKLMMIATMLALAACQKGGEMSQKENFDSTKLMGAWRWMGLLSDGKLIPRSSLKSSDGTPYDGNIELVIDEKEIRQVSSDSRGYTGESKYSYSIDGMQLLTAKEDSKNYRVIELSGDRLVMDDVPKTPREPQPNTTFPPSVYQRITMAEVATRTASILQSVKVDYSTTHKEKKVEGSLSGEAFFRAEGESVSCYQYQDTLNGTYSVKDPPQKEGEPRVYPPFVSVSVPNVKFDYKKSTEDLTTQYTAGNKNGRLMFWARDVSKGVEVQSSDESKCTATIHRQKKSVKFTVTCTSGTSSGTDSSGFKKDSDLTFQANVNCELH